MTAAKLIKILSSKWKAKMKIWTVKYINLQKPYQCTSKGKLETDPSAKSAPLNLFPSPVWATNRQGFMKVMLSASCFITRGGMVGTLGEAFHENVGKVCAIIHTTCIEKEEKRTPSTVFLCLAPLLHLRLLICCLIASATINTEWPFKRHKGRELANLPSFKLTYT